MKSIIKSVLLFSLFIQFSGCVRNDEISSPNFIILQADDLGWDDLPINGNKFVKTPALDQIEENGAYITRFYVNPVCAPSRASLLTGKNFLKTGVSHVHGGKDFLNLSEKTFADVFIEEGYKTGFWGKWHSGKTDGYYPWQRGFQEAFMSQLYKHRNAQGKFNGEIKEFSKWSDEVIVDYAISFIERNKDKPFLAYLSFLTCHSPLDAKKELVEIKMQQGISRNLATLYAMIDQMDTEIGRLLSKVEELNLTENTIIMFMSDNGPAIINNLLNNEDRKIRYHNGIRGHKGNIWENGVKSPLLIQFPEKIKSGKIDLLSDITDILPTMADFAGIDLRKYNLDLTGESFASNLINWNSERPEKVVFNYADAGWPPTDIAWTPKGVKDEYLPLSNKPSLKLFQNQIISVTKQNYKLLKNPSKRETEIPLYENYFLTEIKKDNTEANNLAGLQGTKLKELKEELKKSFQNIIDSPAAFQAVEFQIKKGGENKVLLFAPEIVSDNINVAFDFSYPWNIKSSFATYNCNVENEIIAYPTILKQGTTDEIEYILTIDGKSVKSRKQTESEIIFDPVMISAGKQKLKIEVNHSASYNEIRFSELIFVER